MERGGGGGGGGEEWNTQSSGIQQIIEFQSRNCFHVVSKTGIR